MKRFKAYIAESRLRAESILDRPKPSMDPDMWTVNAEGKYIPTIQASQKIDAVVRWAVSKFGITDPILHVTGSIASNSYGDKSDIDLHFCSDTFKPDDPDEFNKEFRKAFAEEFGPETGSENGFIGVHPIEVYFQPNKFQDMMSVGCYDYFGKKWESGPDIKDTAFDPYSEYYEDDMKHIDKIISDVRGLMLKAYEQALVIRKTEDAKFAEKLFGKLEQTLKDSSKLFDSIRESRKVMSSPKSKEAALKMRKSRKWHIADSAFKLLDRFGYIAVFKTYKTLADEKDRTAILDGIIGAVQDNVMNNKMITDAERAALTEGEVDEGLGSALRRAALAGMMFAPGVAAAKSAPGAGVKPPAMAQMAEPKYAGLSRFNMTNLLATVAYNEAMLDWMKNGNDDTIIAILNVIDNRAGGDPGRYTEVISEKSQFFSVKHVKGGYVDKTYVTYDPATEAKTKGVQISGRQEECWDLCLDYAEQLLDGTLPHRIGDRNMIANMKKDKKSAWNAWGHKCDLAIEGHTFGYDKKHDGYLKYGIKKPAGLTHAPIAQKIYIVKKGDSLWNIAKTAGLTVDQLKLKNGLKSDVIKPGQKLKV